MLTDSSVQAQNSDVSSQLCAAFCYAARTWNNDVKTADYVLHHKQITKVQWRTYHTCHLDQ